MKPILVKTLVYVGIIFSLFSLYQVLFSGTKPFPNLNAGSYVGYFSGDVIDLKDSKVYFAVSSDKNNSQLRFVVFRNGWVGKVIEKLSKQNEVEIPPVLISGSEGVLRFSGEGTEDSGIVTNLITGKTEDWKLFKTSEDLALSSKENSDLRLLGLKAEELDLEAQLTLSKKKFEKLEAEEARYKQALSESKTLEQRAEHRFSERKEEIIKLKSEIADTEKKLSRRYSALAIAKSTTPRGRLTLIARNVMSKEYQQILYKLGGENPSADAVLLAELARAKEALELQRELLNYQQTNDLDEINTQELN